MNTPSLFGEVCAVLFLALIGWAVIMDNLHRRKTEKRWASRGFKIELAAWDLIVDVKLRHPGEDLRCPYMRALDEVLKS